MSIPQQPVAIDPTGCGCTECLTGEYVPMENATREHILGLLKGDLRNNYGPMTATFAPGMITVDHKWDFDIDADDLRNVDATDIVDRLVVAWV